ADGLPDGTPGFPQHQVIHRQPRLHQYISPRHDAPASGRHDDLIERRVLIRTHRRTAVTALQRERGGASSNANEGRDIEAPRGPCRIADGPHPIGCRELVGLATRARLRADVGRAELRAKEQAVVNDSVTTEPHAIAVVRQRVEPGPVLYVKVEPFEVRIQLGDVHQERPGREEQRAERRRRLSPDRARAILRRRCRGDRDSRGRHPYGHRDHPLAAHRPEYQEKAPVRVEELYTTRYRDSTSRTRTPFVGGKSPADDGPSAHPGGAPK